MYVRLWYLPVSGGDGSCDVVFFTDREAAEEYEKKRMEYFGPEYDWGEDCINFKELKFDDYGNLLNPDVWEE